MEADIIAKLTMRFKIVEPVQKTDQKYPLKFGTKAFLVLMLPSAHSRRFVVSYYRVFHNLNGSKVTSTLLKKKVYFALINSFRTSYFVQTVEVELPVIK